jgi:hypothetical protein
MRGREVGANDFTPGAVLWNIGDGEAMLLLLNVVVGRHRTHW